MYFQIGLSKWEMFICYTPWWSRSLIVWPITSLQLYLVADKHKSGYLYITWSFPRSAGPGTGISQYKQFLHNMIIKIPFIMFKTLLTRTITANCIICLFFTFQARKQDVACNRIHYVIQFSYVKYVTKEQNRYTI